MTRQSLVFLAGLFLYEASFGQDVLHQYIQEGFEKNQSIQQQALLLEKSIYALKEAKTRFAPGLSFLSDYYLAAGGRTVDFPAGDLLNPVYGSLNQLTRSNDFPQLENQRILLNPNNFYDARFRIGLSLLNPEIDYNKRIKREQVSFQKVEIDLYKRELAKEIKTAYFTFLQSVAAIKIYDMALELVRENKRINESLFENGKVNRTVVLRAENEITKFQAIRESAQQQSNSARAYFNFLLNRNLADSIVVDDSFKRTVAFYADSTTVGQREELQKLKIAASVNQQKEGLAKSFIIPKLSTFLDLGSQGFDWQLDNHTRYSFFGLSLKWDLFAFGRNSHTIKQAQLDNRIIQSQMDYLEAQLQLQYTNSINEFNSTLFSYESAISTYKASQKYHADVLRLYKEGQALYLELLDAQNQLVDSELQVTISLYETYIKAAEIERANASFNTNN